MTTAAGIYGCRNCNLVFQLGVSSGRTLYPKSWHHYLCTACGLPYRIEAHRKSLTHPLKGLLYKVPNYVPANPKRKDIDTIQEAIRPTMKMRDISIIMRKLPIRNEWSSNFESAYRRAKNELGDNIADMTADELHEACSEYTHVVYDLYGAHELCYIKNGKTFCTAKSQYKDIRDLRPTPPKYTQHVKQKIVHRRNNTSKRPNVHFDDTACINCAQISKIGLPKRNDENQSICPHCHRPQLDTIFGGLRSGGLI